MNGEEFGEEIVSRSEIVACLVGKKFLACVCGRKSKNHGTFNVL